MSLPAAYASRLQIEGAVLAAAGLAGSAWLLATRPQSRRWPASTVAQLALVAAGAAARGPRGVDGWIAAAGPAPADADGEPTPLWHVPLPVLAGAAFVKVVEPLGGPGLLRAPFARAGWDASLRVTGGATLVGLAQALLLAPRVREAERRDGRTYLRLPGSRLGRGTRLGWRS